MSRSWNCIRSDLLARFAGIPAPEVETNWQEWVEDLSNDDADLLIGAFLQKRGWPVIHYSRAYPQPFLLAYVSLLEQEFQTWLCESSEVLDYFLVCQKIGVALPEVGWHWLPEHRRIWEFRDRVGELAPRGVRLAPLVADSILSLVQNQLQTRVTEFLMQLTLLSEGPREYWLKYIEDTCSILKIKEPACITPTLGRLRALRRRLPGISYLGAVNLKDIVSVEKMVAREGIGGLSECLSKLSAELSALEGLGSIDRWVARDANRVYGLEADKVLEGKRSRETLINSLQCRA